MDILESIQKQIPGLPAVQPEQLATHYNPAADTLIVYFTLNPPPTYWSELDDYLLLGRRADQGPSGRPEEVTGVMIEYFTEWLLKATSLAYDGQGLQPA